MESDTGFVGAKLALFLGEELLVIRRDDRDDIPWPDFLDFPGGGREGDEGPEACALRETLEEVSLDLPDTVLIWRRSYERPHGRVWFFVAQIEDWRVDDVVLGDEGQGWELMSPDAYLAHPDAIPHFRGYLLDYLASQRAA
ncbi:NUDIX hydrolase [Pseudooceanicola nanhaiensis]|uniref:NUDIX hydrolase n=1 Tax=Pseudooceanicola nanhaiensis TaxID=375761 RepID=UPI001CD364CF|nr:NUDIX hydrolase [Pseudooceanicola nanhaiensis]MCA0921497.1 NUDIX hydrolase [Pseudooceanicola nanhaiensis]